MNKRGFFTVIIYASLAQAMEPAAEAVRALPTPAANEPVIERAQGELPALHLAIRQGDIHRIEELSKQPSALQSVDADGFSVLHVAVQYGSLEVVQQLLAVGAPKNARNINGQTPLYSATLAEREDLIRLLIDSDVDINIATYNGWTPLHLAAAMGNPYLVQMFLSKGAKTTMLNEFNQTPLHLAIRGQDTTVVAMLIESQIPLDEVDQKMKPYLQQAAEISCLPLMKLLLKAGAKGQGCNTVGIEESVPLVLALHAGDVELAKLLVLAGADVDISYQDETPIHWAILREHGKLIYVFLYSLISKYGKRSASFSKAISQQDSKGRTPVRLAATLDSQESLLLLLEAGAHIKIGTSIDDLCERVLKKAIDSNNQKLVRALATSGTNIYITDISGNTPLHWAASQGYAEIVNLLLNGINGERYFYTASKLGAVEKRNKANQTPVRLAAEGGHVSVLKIMLPLGGSLFIRELYVRKPLLVIAVKARDLAFMNMLLQPDAYLMPGQDSSFFINIADADGKTAMHWAVMIDFLPAVRKLLRSSLANRYAKDQNGDTPFHIAVREGRTAIAEHMLDEAHSAGRRGERVYRESVKGTRDLGLVYVEDAAELNPLQIALQRSDLQMVQLIVEKGNYALKDAHIGKAPRDGQTTILDYLLSSDCEREVCNCYAIYKYFLEKGAKTVFGYKEGYLRSPKHKFLRTIFTLQGLGKRFFPNMSNGKKS